MSSGCAGRASGYPAVRACSCSPVITALNHRVSTGPGQTAFTRISGASARASDFVIVFTAPLLAAYAILDPSPEIPATELTDTIAALGDLLSSGTAARVTKKVPFRFT